MSDLQGKRIAAYARSSTDQGAASIADQLRVCHEYARCRGGIVDEALTFTEHGVGGLSTARSGLQDLQNAVSSGLLDVVLTEDLSRIGRSVANNERLLNELSRAGARVIAINDGFDSEERNA